MASKFNKTDYAINKVSAGIVYKGSTDEMAIEISYESIVATDPSFTMEDFEKLKAVSDDIYHEEAKSEGMYNKYVKGTYSNTSDSIWLATDSLEDELEKISDNLIASAKIKKLLAEKLTPIQRKRFVLFAFKGLTTREIADIEHTTQRAVWDSIEAARKKLKKYF